MNYWMRTILGHFHKSKQSQFTPITAPPLFYYFYIYICVVFYYYSTLYGVDLYGCGSHNIKTQQYIIFTLRDYSNAFSFSSHVQLIGYFFTAYKSIEREYTQVIGDGNEQIIHTLRGWIRGGLSNMCAILFVRWKT